MGAGPLDGTECVIMGLVPATTPTGFMLAGGAAVNEDKPSAFSRDAHMTPGPLAMGKPAPVVMERIPCIVLLSTVRGVMFGLGDVVRAWVLLGGLGEPLDCDGALLNDGAL